MPATYQLREAQLNDKATAQDSRRGGGIPLHHLRSIGLHYGAVN